MKAIYESQNLFYGQWKIENGIKKRLIISLLIDESVWIKYNMMSWLKCIVIQFNH